MDRGQFALNDGMTPVAKSAKRTGGKGKAVKAEETPQTKRPLPEMSGCPDSPHNAPRFAMCGRFSLAGGIYEVGIGRYGPNAAGQGAKSSSTCHSELRALRVTGGEVGKR